jgi:hypothetical protein
MSSSQEIKKQIRESLGLPPQQENHPTVPVEGHICDFPIWSYSKRRCSVTSLHIDYEDGTYFTLKAPEGLPSPSFPGYLDSILFFGQRDLFKQEYVEISIYSIFKTLELDTNNGGIYEIFRRDMKRAFAMYMETDRFREPNSGVRSHVSYFRVLNTMKIAKTRNNVSTFYFNELFLSSLRAGYLKRLDFDFCISLDRENKPLSRFLYSHILKRLGEKSIYLRNMVGFLYDIGLGHVADLPPKHRNQKIRQVLYPALNGIQGEAFSQWEADDKGNIVFIP